MHDNYMQAALARFELPTLPPLDEVVRMGAVVACALALIFAGPLPF